MRSTTARGALSESLFLGEKWRCKTREKTRDKYARILREKKKKKKKKKKREEEERHRNSNQSSWAVTL